jgi:integrase
MLTRAIDSYLALRRATGFNLAATERLLRNFARFATERGEGVVRAHTAIDWAALAPSPNQKDRRLKVVILFARHMRVEDGCHEVPPDGVFGKHLPQRRIPFILSLTDIQRLVTAASSLGPPGSLRPHTYSTLFALLAATGLRVSEALALCFQDLSADGLVVRETKFRKSRLVPLHDTAVEAMDRYLEHRRRFGGADDHLFVSSRGRALPYQTVVATFLRLVRAIGLRGDPGKPGPRIHDLRHGFAVRALESCSTDRDRVSRHMLALSTYLGHSKVAHTYWYLQATPQLLADIADAGESHFLGGAP